MIARLKGLLDSLTEDGAVIDVGGVGYLVFCSSRTLSAMPGVGGAVALEIETHVREDHIHLYGFASLAERDWFRLLTTVQGVGARVGLAILSVLPPEQLTQAIAAQDKAAVSRANGVGPKLAARIVSELKDKAGGIALGPAAQAPGGAAVTDAPGAIPSVGAELEDAVSALVNLGYSRTDAFGAAARAARDADGSIDTATLIRSALQELGR